MKKQRIKVEQRVCGFDVEEYTLGEAMDHIEMLIEHYGTDAVIKTEYYGSDDGIYQSIFVMRDETDDEYEKRIKKEKEIRENRRAIYESLKKEFEGK